MSPEMLKDCKQYFMGSILSAVKVCSLPMHAGSITSEGLHRRKTELEETLEGQGQAKLPPPLPQQKGAL